MLTLSGAVHLMNYYRDISAFYQDHRGSRAMLLGFKPTLFSSITTSLGMASLATSQLSPIREFGLYSAISLSFATLFLLLGFPFISDWFCREGRSKGSLQLEPIVEPNLLPSQPTVELPQHASTRVVNYVAWMERQRHSSVHCRLCYLAYQLLWIDVPQVVNAV